MMDVVGIGSALFDILMTAEGFPAEDTKMQGKETKLQCGGPCATGLVAISKLGETASFMGTVGDDLYGTFVKAEMERYGVDSYVSRCACVAYGSAETVFYVAAVYFAGIKRKKLPLAIAFSLLAYLVSVVLCCLLCRVM